MPYSEATVFGRERNDKLKKSAQSYSCRSMQYMSYKQLEWDGSNYGLVHCFKTDNNYFMCIWKQILLWDILHWTIPPQRAEGYDSSLKEIQIMWSRDGSLDSWPHALFQLNHFDHRKTSCSNKYISRQIVLDWLVVFLQTVLVVISIIYNKCHCRGYVACFVEGLLLYSGLTFFDLLATLLRFVQRRLVIIVFYFFLKVIFGN